jgi:hypothetical protein
VTLFDAQRACTAEARDEDDDEDDASVLVSFKAHDR